MPSYNSTARTPFAHGGSVKKPKPKRIILWKGKVKDWPGAQKAKERTGKAKGGAFLPLRGGVTTAKAFRGKEGFKESQALQKKITGKTKRSSEDKEKISSKRAISILKQHGHKSKVKGDKIKVAYHQGGGGTFKTKVETLPKNPTLARVKDFLGYKEGGIISFKKGGKADKKWIQKATKGMRKDKPCTGKKFGSATCPPGSKRYNLAQTFKKMARSKHASGGFFYS